MNRSKLSGNELTKLKDGLIGVRYPMNPIQAATALDTKINSLMKCDQAKQFSSLAEKYGYNAFREVRGDGNCFFRAVAFITLHSLKSTSFSKCFPQFGKVQLTTCKADSVPKNMKQYYEETVLRRVL